MAKKTKQDSRDPMMGFRCPPEMRDTIERIAKAEKRSKSSVVLLALEAQLAKWKRKSKDS